MLSPVFIVGSARSGTTLLYHMLLASSGFAVYRAETHIFSVLPPYFGPLSKSKNKDRLISFWIKSAVFERAGLDAEAWRNKYYYDISTYSDLLVCFMGAVAESQGVERWAECTPANLLHMKEIKRGIPDAKFIHIIRDGRDVSISLDKLSWVDTIPVPFSNLSTLNSAALTWQWTVSKGKKAGISLEGDYLEVHFEELLASPEKVLSRIGNFITHDISYDYILDHPIGSVSKPNTAFKGDCFSPKERWRLLTEPELKLIEEFIAPTLKNLGYSLQCKGSVKPSLRRSMVKLQVELYLNTKYWLKYHTKFGRWFGETPMEFDENMQNIFSDKE